MPSTSFSKSAVAAITVFSGPVSLKKVGVARLDDGREHRPALLRPGGGHPRHPAADEGAVDLDDVTSRSPTCFSVLLDLGRVRLELRRPSA